MGKKSLNPSGNLRQSRRRCAASSNSDNGPEALMNSVPLRKLKALVDGHLTDCVFLVGRDDDQAKEIRAFKLELMVSSEYFSGLLNSPLTLANPGPIRMKAIEPDIFKLVIEFIHLAGHLQSEVESLEACLQLTRAADEYLLEDLSVLCQEQLRQKFVTRENAWTVLSENHLINCIAIVCLETLSKHTSFCLNHASFFEASEEAIKMFLTLGDMDIDSEMELVRACMSYAFIRKGPKESEKDIFRRVCLPSLRLLLLSTFEQMEVLRFLTVEEKTFLAAFGSPLKEGWSPIPVPGLSITLSRRSTTWPDQALVDSPSWSVKRRRAIASWKDRMDGLGSL